MTCQYHHLLTHENHYPNSAKPIFPTDDSAKPPNSCLPDHSHHLHFQVVLGEQEAAVEARGQGEGGGPVHHQDVELPRVVGEEVPVPTPVEELLLCVQGLLLGGGGRDSLLFTLLEYKEVH